jgi:hypothetical protein
MVFSIDPQTAPTIQELFSYVEPLGRFARRAILVQLTLDELVELS